MGYCALQVGCQSALPAILHKTILCGPMWSISPLSMHFPIVWCVVYIHFAACMQPTWGSRNSEHGHAVPHAAMKMHGKIVLESMEGSCVRIGPGVDAYALKQCSKHCHTPGYCRSSHFQSAASHRPSHSCHPISVIVMSYAGILYCHTAPFPPNSCVHSPVHMLLVLCRGGGGAL